MNWNTYYLKFTNETEARVVEQFLSAEFFADMIGALSWIENEAVISTPGYHVNVRTRNELPVELAGFVIKPQHPKVVWAD